MSNTPGNSKRSRTPAQIACQFKPGQSGNPSGRPRKIVSDGLREFLENNPEKIRELNAALVDSAIAGDAKAYQTVRETIEGKLPQALEHTGNQTITHSFDSSKLSDDELAQVATLIESANARADQG